MYKLVCSQPTTSRCGGRGMPPVPPEVVPCGEGESYPDWLRRVLERLAGGKANLDFYIRIAEGRVTDGEIARLLGVSRLAARRFRLRWFSEMRRGWLSHLSAVALDLLRTRRFVAIRPYTLRAVAVPASVRVVAGECQFGGVPSCGELTAFCEGEDVYPTLFGRHGAVLTLTRKESGNTTAAVVVPNGGHSAAQGLEDGFGLAA